MADPDLELRGGGEGGGNRFFLSLSPPAFLPSTIFFKTKIKMGAGHRCFAVNKEKRSSDLGA